MVNKFIKMVTCTFFTLLFIAIFPEIAHAATLGVNYQSQIQNIGWQGWVSDGQVSGTVGQSLRLEAIKINITGALPGMGIMYNAHVQDVGWQGWVTSGQVAGTIQESKRMEAIQIKLINAPGYNVKYRAHVQNIGWQDWVQNGQIAGTVGQSLRMEAIQIQIEKVSCVISLSGGGNLGCGIGVTGGIGIGMCTADDRAAKLYYGGGGATTPTGGGAAILQITNGKSVDSLSGWGLAGGGSVSAGPVSVGVDYVGSHNPDGTPCEGVSIALGAGVVPVDFHAYVTYTILSQASDDQAASIRASVAAILDALNNNLTNTEKQIINNRIGGNLFNCY